MIKNASKTHSNSLEFFCKKIKVHRCSGSKNRGKHSKNSRKPKETPKPMVMRPKPTQLDGSGPPERLRGVGLIRIHQDLDLTVPDVGRWIGSEPTRSSVLI